MAQQNATPLVAVVLGLIIGGVSGFYIREFAVASKDIPAGTRPPGMMGAGARPGGMVGGGGPPAGMMGGGGGGFGGGGNSNSGGLALARLVRNLDQIQQSQGKGITPEQSKALLPILQKVKSAETLPAEEADKQIAAIQGALTDDQKKVLEGMQQGGFGGGGGRGGGGGMMGGPPGGAMGGPPSGAMPGGPGGGPSGPPGGGGPGGGPPGGGAARAPGGPGGPGGMGGGGGRPDPEKPFATERNQKALDSLIAGLGKS